MLCGTGGYLGSEKAYGAVSGVYPGSNYPCYYTNMDYLSPGIQSHSALNVPVSITLFLSMTNMYPGVFDVGLWVMKVSVCLLSKSQRCE